MTAARHASPPATSTLARKIRALAAETLRSIYAGTATEWGDSPQTPGRRPAARATKEKGNKIMIRRIVTALAATAALLTLGATAASASVHPQITPACSTGHLAGSCGTQVSASAPALGLAANKAAQNTPVIGKSDLTTSATDWYWFTDTAGQKTAEYAPRGVESGYCMAQTAVGSGFVLRHCNGSAWQQFNYNTADNGTWTDVATGQVIAVTRQAQPVVAVTPVAPFTPTPAETFTFDTQLIPA